MKSAVIVLSGGMDSATAMWQLLKQGSRVEALTVNYGQRHKREILAAEALCEVAGVLHHVVDLSPLRSLLCGPEGGSALVDDATDVPEGHYAEESMKATVVPNRNMVLLSVAIARAVAIKADAVVYGAHAGDHAIYPDCRPQFFKHIERAALRCDWHSVVLRAPFIDITKADIVALGSEFGVPFRLTWSCYKGGQFHCGKCGTCVERREAFQLAGVDDPTEYEEA